MSLSLSKTSLTDAVLFWGSYRDYVLMRSCGSDCDIRMWSGSSGSAPITLLSPSCTIGCPTETCLSTYVTTPVSTNSVWYAVIPITAVDLPMTLTLYTDTSYWMLPTGWPTFISVIWFMET